MSHNSTTQLEVERLARLQLKLLGVSVEVGLEIGDGHTVGVRVVDTQSATHVDVLYADAMRDEFLLQLVDAIAKSLEITHVENLRTNVEVQTYELDVRQFLSLANHGYHIAHGDTKLVLSQTRGDVGMGVGTNIRIQTERYASHFSFGCCEFVDNLEFGDAFYVEAENVVIEAKIDFPIALAYTCINNLIIGEARLERSFDLAATHAIGSKTCLADDAEHTGVGVGLDGIVNHKALVLARLVVDSLQRAAQ